MDLCQPSIYAGCQMTATLNLPFTDWVVEDGTYANFTITSQSDSCATIICQNNAKAAVNPNQCSFVYDPKFGSRLFASGTAGNAGGIQATYNLAINCTKREDPMNNRYYGKSIAPCPTDADRTKRTINFNVPGHTLTSPKTTDAAKYQISVCPDKTVFAQVDYRLQSVDKVSAFASYICSTAPCNVDISPPSWHDDSGTALNYVLISNLQNTMLWLNVYGWGQFTGINSYVFSIEIKDV